MQLDDQKKIKPDQFRPARFHEFERAESHRWYKEGADHGQVNRVPG